MKLPSIGEAHCELQMAVDSALEAGMSYREIREEVRDLLETANLGEEAELDDEC